MQTTPGTPLTGTASRPAGGVRWRGAAGLLSAVAVSAWVLDQATKWWAVNSLTAGVPKHLLGSFLQLRLTHNAGMAFSLGTSYTVVLTAVALAVVVVILRMARRIRSRLWAVALGLVLGGALGNVTDRMIRPPAPLRGQVVDFLELPHWPIFNVADSCISVAAVIFVYLSFRGIRIDGTVERSPQVDSGSPDTSDGV